MESKRDRLTEIYADYYSIVYSAVYTKIGNSEDSKDICQEVFIRLYSRIDEVENVRKWLFNALKLVVLEYFREKRKNNNLDIADVFQDVSLTFVNGFRDARIIISEALENIDNFKDETERKIFDLIAVSNYTYENASMVLGFSRRQVEYRYGLIVRRILDYLEKKGIENIEDLL